MLTKVKKVLKQKNGKGAAKPVVSRKVKDYGNEPYFVKKADAAKEVLDKYGFPKGFAPVK